MAIQNTAQRCFPYSAYGKLLTRIRTRKKMFVVSNVDKVFFRVTY